MSTLPISIRQRHAKPRNHPGLHLAMRMNSEINIDNILPSIAVPTLVLHRTEDPTVSIQAGRFLAEHIQHAKLVELDGPDHIYWIGDNALQIADLITGFIAQPSAE